jgi:hypothetical protein
MPQAGWRHAPPTISHYLNVSTGGWLFQCFKKKPEFGQPAGDLVKPADKIKYQASRKSRKQKSMPKDS